MSLNYEALRAQAEALRRQGFSTRQIGKRLGLNPGTVSRWVSHIPFEGFNEESLAEQAEDHHTAETRARALEMRRQGFSYNLIAAELHVAKSTLSLWLRDVAFGDYHPEVKERMEKGRRAIETMAQLRKVKYAALRAEADDEALKEMEAFLASGISERELFIAGLMLYWGEGAKTNGAVSLTNSNPGAINLFIVWVKHCLNIELHRLRGHIFTHPDVDIEAAESYWSGVSGIPREHFYKTSVDIREGKAADKKGKLEYGTFHIIVTGEGVTLLQRKILVWIEQFSKHIAEKW